MQIKTLHQVAQEEYEYQQRIISKEIVPCDTGYNFLNDRLLGGTNKEDIILLAGLSGTGKSTLAMRVGYNLVTLNKNVRVLYLSFEVPGRKIAAKLISKEISQTLKEMYTSDILIDKERFDQFKGLPFHILEVPVNVDVIDNVITEFCNKYPNDRVHVIYDHTLLVDNRSGDNENDTLMSLSRLVNRKKKEHDLVGILISQLNNAMLDPKRLVYKGGHYPNQTDIFGSKYLYHVSNNVVCIVSPTGLKLPSNTYGLDDLPFTITNKSQETLELYYAHTIKARDGELGIDPLVNRLKYSFLKEFNRDQRAIFGKTHSI